MMLLLQNYASTIYIFGGVLLAVLIGAWFNTKKKETLIGAGVTALVLVVLFVLINTMPPGDKGKIRKVLYGMAEAVETNQIEDSFQYFHTKRPDNITQAKRISRYTFRKVTIKPNLQIEVDLETRVPTAKATFNVVVKGDFSVAGFAGESVPRYVEVIFHKEDGKWKVWDFKHYSPTKNLRKQPGG